MIINNYLLFVNGLSRFIVHYKILWYIFNSNLLGLTISVTAYSMFSMFLVQFIEDLGKSTSCEMDNISQWRSLLLNEGINIILLFILLFYTHK